MSEAAGHPDTAPDTLKDKGCTLAFDADGIARITFDLPGKVNVMNDDFMSVMETFVGRLESRKDLSGVIITSAKHTFIAGGDLGLMGRAQKGQESFLFAHFERLKGFLRRLEKLRRPVVAAVNGSALGGGLELALACNHRIALNREDIVVGLPEVGFGILPGAGGVVRLTRMVGLELALDYLLSGKKVGVATALADGIIDELADDEAAMLQKARAWIRANPRAVNPWDRPDQDRMPARETPPPAAAQTSYAASRIFDLAVRSASLDVDTALRLETEGLVELMVRPDTAALIASFFNRPRAS